MRNRQALAVLATAASLVTLAPIADVAEAAPSTSYYVSCDGDDNATGRSPSKPWRTIGRANDAELAPGDGLLFERGCIWNGTRLNVTWSGTADDVITIANYGSGAKPLIKNGKNSNVKITGSHLLVRGIRVDFTTLPTVACDQPIGEVYGFNLTGGAHYVTIANSEASGATAGIHLSKNSRENTIRDNRVFDNDVLTSFGANPSKDLGAWGILIRSDDNRIIDNRISDNRARCRNQGFKLMSNSVEIFEGDDNYIARNRSTGDRVFSELGSSATDIAEGNVFEFNVFDTDVDESRFITTRGSGVAFGPVRSTRVLHNTVHSTGDGSKGVVCGGSCGAGILELRNNVIVAQEKAIYASGAAIIGINLVWSGDGDPFVQLGSNGYDESPNLMMAPPRFVNAARGNFRLRSDSAGVGQADGVRVSDVDAAKRTITGPADLGAFDS